MVEIVINLTWYDCGLVVSWYYLDKGKLIILFDDCNINVWWLRYYYDNGLRVWYVRWQGLKDSSFDCLRTSNVCDWVRDQVSYIAVRWL